MIKFIGRSSSRLGKDDNEVLTRHAGSRDTRGSLLKSLSGVSAFLDQNGRH